MGDNPTSVQRNLVGHLFKDGRTRARTRADLSQNAGKRDRPDANWSACLSQHRKSVVFMLGGKKD